MLQKLKLMFNLEIIAIQRNLDHIAAELAAAHQAPGINSKAVEVTGAKLVRHLKTCHTGAVQV